MRTLWSSNVGEGAVSFSPTECHLLSDGRVVVVSYNDRQHGVDDRDERSLLETMRGAWPVVFATEAQWVHEWRPDDRHFTSEGWRQCGHLLRKPHQNLAG
jgi:hypothetical protein